MAVGNLQVDLTLETGEFSAGIKKVQVEVGGLASSLAGIGTAFAGGLIAGGTMALLRGMGPLIRGIAENFKELKEAAFGLNQSAASFLALEQGLERLGVSSKNATNSIKSIGDVIQDAYFNKAGKAKAVLDALGVSLFDQEGKARPVIDVLGQLAEEWRKLPEGMEKARAAQELFGAGAQQMSAALNQGEQALRDSAAAANESATTWAKMNAAYESVIEAVRNGLVGAFEALIAPLTTLSGELDNNAVGWDFLKGVIAATVGAFAGLIQIVTNVIGILGGLVQAVDQSARALGNLSLIMGNFFLGEFKAAGEAFDAFKDRGTGAIEGIKKSFSNLANAPADALNAATTAAETMANRLTVSKNATSQANTTLSATTADVTQKTQALRTALSEVDKEAKKGGGRQMADELAQWASRLLDAMDPTRVFAREVEKLNEAMARGLIPADQYAAAIEKLKEQSMGGTKSLNSQFEELNRSVIAFGSRVGDAFIDAIADGKDFGQVLKSLITDLAKMFFRLLVMKPLMDGLFGGAAGGGIMGISATRGVAVDPTAPAIPMTRSPGPELRQVSMGSAAPSLKTNEQSSINLGEMTINIDSRGGSVQADRENTRELARKIRESVVSVLVDERRPGGLLAGVR